jgi:carboxylesterase
VSYEPAGSPADSEGIAPFHFPGDRRPPCLLIHGFTGTPYETRALAEYLHGRGYTALGVRLAGHGESLERLEQATWEDWYRDVAGGCATLVRAHGPVVAIGVSTGALLAAHLAHERPRDVLGLCFIATALVLGDWRARLGLPIVARIPWLRRRFRFIPKKPQGSDIADDEARQRHPSHPAIPLTGALSLLALQRRVRGELPAITHPSLLIHGALDRTCPPLNVERVVRALGAKPRRMVILPRSAHVVTVDCEREQVKAAVGEFIDELGAESTPTPPR